MSDYMIVACIPDCEQTRQQIGDMMGLKCEIYAGSVPGTCCRCQKKIWLGPKQKELTERVRNCKTLCLTCVSRDDPSERTVVPLANKKWGE